MKVLDFGLAKVFAEDSGASDSFNSPTLEMLPDGNTVLLTIQKSGGRANDEIAAVNLRSGEKKIHVRGGTHAQYVSTGHLIYAAVGGLRAVAFDPKRLELRGEPMPISIRAAITNGGAVDAAVSANGTLVYHVGTNEYAGQRKLAWVDKQANERADSSRELVGRAHATCSGPVIAQ